MMDLDLAQPPRWYKRHPGLTLIAVNAALLLALAVAAELFLRIYIPFNPGYYTAVSGTNRRLDYPFGSIPINSDGFPDHDFDLTKPHKVGYFGDSVTYGVGAGYGYRVSELLEPAYPTFEHLNLGGIGLSISQHEIEYCVRLAKRYSLDHAIYLFNLNDILPDQEASGETQTPVTIFQSTLIDRLDWLRGKSFLYTYLRTAAKQVLESRGIGFHGYPAYELFPVANTEVLRETALRVNQFNAALASSGVALSVVLLPYEMQISSDAADTYRSHQIHWEDDFEDRGAQAVLTRFMDPSIPTFDAYFAFVDPVDSAASKSRNHVGQFFVYNKGDKLDWNHPNREGHRAIADYLVRQHVLGLPAAERPE